MSAASRFLPLTYQPRSPWNRLVDRVTRLGYAITYWCSGLPPLTDDQWALICTLMRRTVLARHIYVLISTDEDCPRTVGEITSVVNTYRQEVAAAGARNDVEVVTEEDVARALNELRAHGLTDDVHRLRAVLEYRA